MAVKVSVVIPTYNRRDTLMRAIASVQAQSYPISELIVVDDGSDDGTEQAVKAVDGVRIYQENQGVSAARNCGIEACSNPYISFLIQMMWLNTIGPGQRT